MQFSLFDQKPIIPDSVIALRNRGAAFFINHSGGKDSQAMTAFVRSFVPDSQIVIIHAPLGDVEWPGTIEHIEATTQGLEFILAPAVKTFFQMVDRRGRWPMPSVRQCTSDLKRGPIEREIRRWIKRTGNNVLVQCLGLRAEESSCRAKATPFQFDQRNSKAGREWYNWLPIHDWTLDQVWREIERAGQKPHWAYAKGMTRLSCSFCIMASEADLKTAARLRPDLYAKYCAKEKELNHSFLMPKKGQKAQFLPERLGIFEEESF